MPPILPNLACNPADQLDTKCAYFLKNHSKTSKHNRAFVSSKRYESLCTGTKSLKLASVRWLDIQYIIWPATKICSHWLCLSGNGIRQAKTSWHAACEEGQRPREVNTIEEVTLVEQQPRQRKRAKLETPPNSPRKAPVPPSPGKQEVNHLSWRRCCSSQTRWPCRRPRRQQGECF